MGTGVNIGGNSMPMYVYRDKKTGIELEVIRSFEDYQVIPDRLEAGALSDAEYEAADWERVIKVDRQQSIRPGWKGNP